MTGRTVAHYQVLDKLGEGGMGVVYKARDTRLDRFVALKFLPEVTAERQARFVQEARAASALNHPNIITIHDIGESEGRHYIAMEYVAGKTLDALIPRKGMRVSAALKIAVQVADALARAHAAGIIHRDLKPSNVMVDEHGLVKVLDFGLAKLTEPSVGQAVSPADLPTQTAEGAIVGTVGYMSPEQAEGKPVDARSDIFSFGSLLYEMVTGQRAFKGDSHLSTLAAVLREEPAPLPAGTPHDLEKLVTRCLRKDPARRFQHLDDVKIALEELNEESDSGKLAGAPPVAVRARRARPLWIVVGAAVLAAATLAWYYLRPPPAAAAALAVLPFHNLSQNQEDEFLSDGLADDIANSLTRFAGLRVVAGASARTFRGKQVDLQEVGSKLRVGHVLEGGLRKSGSRIRLTVQLYRVADGSLLWGRNYEREMADVFAVQEDVARNIVSELRVKPAGRPAPARGTLNTEAYQLYLKGRHYQQRQTAETLPRSRECFEQAIALDPKYALAYYGLADYCWIQSFHGSTPPRDLFIQGQAAAAKALELDQTLAEAHAMLGIFRAALEFDWRGAERQFRRALDLDPSSAISRDRYAEYLLQALRRHEEAIAEMNRVVESDPLSVYYQYHLARALIYARQYDRAIEVSRGALALDPSAWLAQFSFGMALARKQMYQEASLGLEKAAELSGYLPSAAAGMATGYAYSGRRSEALEFLRQMAEAGRTRYVSPYLLAEVRLALGEKDRTLELLAKTVEDRSPYIFWLVADPGWDPVRSDPRYGALLRKMKLGEGR